MTLYKVLSEYQVDGDALLARAGLEFLLCTGHCHQQVTVADMDKFVVLAIDATGDPALGLREARYFSPGTFQGLGLALMACPTLRDFCDLLVKHFNKLIMGSSVTFHEQGRDAWLVLEPPRDRYSEKSYRWWVDTAFAVWLKFIRLIHPPEYQAKKITFRAAEIDGHRTKYNDYFHCPVIFSAHQNAFYFDAATLDDALPGGNYELMMYNETLISKILSGTDLKDIKVAVAAKIPYLLNVGACSKKALADSLGLSMRNLDQKLLNAGTNYQLILDDIRRDLAQRYLKTTNYSVTQISYLLGFNDSANFTRGFKKWTGASPSEYRAARKGETLIE
ncbi:MAG: AraC family transcriptional regulator [Porticoccaceae bacterium]|nr:AraC family transcriptional regulator [Porticoccaceae bacterium]